MAETSTKNIETIGYVVHGPKEEFKLEELVLDEMQDDELLVDMKYSGICHTVRQPLRIREASPFAKLIKLPIGPSLPTR